MTDAETFIAGEKRVYESGGNWIQPAISAIWEHDYTDDVDYLIIEFPDQSRVIVANGEARIGYL